MAPGIVPVLRGNRDFYKSLYVICTRRLYMITVYVEKKEISNGEQIFKLPLCQEFPYIKRFIFIILIIDYKGNC